MKNWLVEERERRRERIDRRKKLRVAESDVYGRLQCPLSPFVLCYIHITPLCLSLAQFAYVFLDSLPLDSQLVVI